ncbi:hypothetical protein EHS14_00910 [Schaalia georgiae]|nr:hypothetical protein EHS14_00910 [Schaalia georgiae]
MNTDDPSRIIALVAATEILANAWRTMLPPGTRNLARRIPHPSGGGSGGVYKWNADEPHSPPKWRRCRRR